MLFGVRLRSLFTSRWLALLWAVLVVLTAIQFVGGRDDGAEPQDNGMAATASDASDGLTNAQRTAIRSAL